MKHVLNVTVQSVEKLRRELEDKGMSSFVLSYCNPVLQLPLSQNASVLLILFLAIPKWNLIWVRLQIAAASNIALKSCVSYGKV